MDKLAPILAATITVAWVIAFLVNAINPAYQIPAELSLMMSSVVSICLGVDIIQRTRKDESH